MIGPLRQHRNLPAIRTGYPIFGGRCPFSIVVPIARTNEILNPSGETNTTGYTAGAGSLARSTAQQFYGAYSFAYTPSAATGDGFYYGTIATTAGQTRAIHCRWLGVAGVVYKLSVATTGGVDLISTVFTATGRWQWVKLLFTETTSTTRRIYFTKSNSASTATYYIDGVQSEVCETGQYWPTTYIDGDQMGFVPNQFPPAYLWNGTPHASTSSRSGQTRAGGRVINLSKFGLILTAIVGLGLVPPQHQGQAFAVLDGSSYDRTRKPDRGFSLVGRIDAPDDLLLQRYRADLAALLDRDLIGEQQRLKILYQVEDAWGNPTTDQAEITALYQSGLEGNHDNDYAQQAVITFTQNLPVVALSGQSGAPLGISTSVSNANRVLSRSPTGVWSALGTGANNTVYAVMWASSGRLYAAGTFTSIGGVAASKIAYWDGSAWNAMGTGASGGDVYAIVEGPNGDIYAAGDFTSMGGVANTARIARWNGSAWNALSTGANSIVVSLAVGPNGQIYAGGQFTSIGGVAANYIARWDGSAWNAIAGLPNIVNHLIVAPSGTIYVATGGVGGFYQWTGSWSLIGSVSGGAALSNQVAIDSQGYLYGGGDFTAVSGVSAANIAKWNGVAWSALGSGLSGGGISSLAGELKFDRLGQLHVAGTFTSAGGMGVPDGYAIWNGSSWLPPDLDFPGGSLYSVSHRLDGALAIGFSSVTSTALTPAQTTITNSGSARAYPTIVIRGGGFADRLYIIRNETTGRAIYFNMNVWASEVITLNFDPQALSFESTIQGNIAGKIVAGSNEADFFLQPGPNLISYFATEALSGTTPGESAVMYWTPTYASLDDLVLTP